MFFRFGAALLLVVVISLAGIFLEKRTLALKRNLSHQTFQLDVLREQHATLRLRTQQLGAPTRLIDALESGSVFLSPRRRWARSSPVQTARGDRQGVH